MSDERFAAGDPLELLPDFHRSTRMPLDAVVRLHFEGTVAYQNGFAANVSALGMFVKHPDPPPIETRLVFEFVLGEERKPVQGSGIVSWVREKYEGPGRPAGVGIRFTELDALSRQHIAEALFEYLESQLGVDVADHPDVPDLLAAVPQRSDVQFELVSSDEPAPPPAAAEVAGRGAERPAQAEPPPPSPPQPAPRFQLFDDDIADAVGTTDTNVADLFTPAVPPDEPLPIASAGRRRERSKTVPAILTMTVVVAAILAAWWFLAGPGSVPDLPSPEVEAATAAPPSPPRLDPQPGPDRTLAESVGAVEPPAVAEGAEATGVADEAAAHEADAADDSGAAEPAPPPAATTTIAPVAPPPAPIGGRLSRVTEIAWDSAPGTTTVSLIADGAFAPGSYRWYEMGGDRPRVLIRIPDVATGYPRPAIEVGSPELTGVRIGYHQKPTGNELHVVLDLGAADVRVDEVAAEGSTLQVRLSRPSPS